MAASGRRSAAALALVAAALVAALAGAGAGCPYAHAKAAAAAATPPEPKPVAAPATMMRKLVRGCAPSRPRQRCRACGRALPPTPFPPARAGARPQAQQAAPTYEDALRALAAEFERLIGGCFFSLAGMSYLDVNVAVYSAGACVRARMGSARGLCSTAQSAPPPHTHTHSLAKACSSPLACGCAPSSTTPARLGRRRATVSGARGAHGPPHRFGARRERARHGTSAPARPARRPRTPPPLPFPSPPPGGPNGSIGVGCPAEPCGDKGTPVAQEPGTACANGDMAAGGFTDMKSYCCPARGECIAHSQDKASGATVPVCLEGSRVTVELCRRENDGLLPTVEASARAHVCARRPHRPGLGRSSVGRACGVGRRAPPPRSPRPSLRRSFTAGTRPWPRSCGAARSSR